MTGGERPDYSTLDVPAYVGGKPVLLAARKDQDPENRTVIAMFPWEAESLWRDGRLTGWAPVAAASGRGEQSSG